MSKTILVTGASSGMGWDFAKALAEKGYTVYAAARRVERMSSLRAFGITPQNTLRSRHVRQATFVRKTMV